MPPPRQTRVATKLRKEFGHGRLGKIATALLTLRGRPLFATGRLRR